MRNNVICFTRNARDETGDVICNPSIACLTIQASSTKLAHIRLKFAIFN